MARIVGAPKAATGLSKAKEAAGAIAELRIACFLVGLVIDFMFSVQIRRMFSEQTRGNQTSQKATKKKVKNVKFL